MKNVHLIPTDKPSRLYTLNSSKKLYYTNNNLNQIKLTVNQNIYITSDEEIKDGDYGLIGNEVGKIILTEDGYEFLIGKGVSYLYGDFHSLQKVCKKIILTTDQELIKNGVQAIDDEFLEWYVKNPSCEIVEVEITEISCIIPNFGDVDKYRIAIPKEEPKQTDENGKPLTYWGGLAEHKQETLEEEPKQITSLDGDGLGGIPKGILTMLIGKKEETLEEAAVFKSHHSEEDFIRGGRWQQERSYSDEEVLEILDHHTSYLETFIYQYIDRHDMEVNRDWFKQFKKK